MLWVCCGYVCWWYIVGVVGVFSWLFVLVLWCCVGCVDVVVVFVIVGVGVVGFWCCWFAVGVVGVLLVHCWLLLVGMLLVWLIRCWYGWYAVGVLLVHCWCGSLIKN